MLTAAMTRFACRLLALLLTWGGLFGAAGVRAEEISLAGAWKVTLDNPQGLAGPWHDVALPGTLDDAGIGDPLTLPPVLNLRVLTRLQRRHSYTGPAWYRREITIPEQWAGRPVTLELERVLWESRVFVDGREISRADSLTTPHRHELGALSPGRHELTLQIDNRELYRDVSHHIRRYQYAENETVATAYSNHSQVIWNGVLGRVVLRAGRPVAIAHVTVFPQLASRRLDIELDVTNLTGAPSVGTVALTLSRRDGQVPLARTERSVTTPSGGGRVRLEWTLPDGADVSPWDEFSPTLYRLGVAIAGAVEPAVETDFGFRDLAARGTELQLNGHRLFLRGDLECAVFPLTGYPPTDAAAWRKLFGEARKWGINHFRFHSWCPPEAAFVAADELGFYLQVELPHWCERPEGHDTASWTFLTGEADRILAEYGNHPSFSFLSLGNELQGDYDRLNALVQQLKTKDPRRLYTPSTFTFQKGHGRAPEPAADYFITQYTDAGWVRGQGIFNEQPPAFDADYRSACAGITKPLVAHEIGQYAVYPDLREIDRYTGNLVPLNFIAVREDLAKKGLLALAPEFTAASGRFAALLYKEEIERALRTPQFSGFQLLQLQDFPGQGTALIGMLNVFWEPKGFCTAEEFRRACGPVVPLARFPKAVYERGETFHASVEIANFRQELPDAEAEWTMRESSGAVIARGSFGPTPVPLGNGRSLGAIDVPIPVEGPASQWQLEVAVRGTEYRNQWSVWVYPRGVVEVPAGVRITTVLEDALRALAAGERVVFAPPPERIRGIEGRFVPVFWSPVHFPKQPGTMGILCDPAHPALRAFPTEAYSNWQWWDPARRSRSVVIDDVPVVPIVRVIDNFTRNHSLANVFEARVGAGRLLFCAIDITSDLTNRPVARQLRASLLRYAASDEFAPKPELTPAQLGSFLR